MTRRPSGRKLFEIALVSDTHVNEREDFSTSPYPANALANARARHVFAQIAQGGAAFAVHNGDMVNPVPELPTYADAARNFREIASVLPMPLHLVPGNHDIGDKPVDWMPAGMVDAHNIAAYEREFGRHFHAFDHEGVHFVLLNASLVNSGDPAEAEQRAWLEADLEAAAGRRTFVFIHYPPYVSDPAEPSSYDNIDEPGRGWLLDLVRRHRPEALFAAHVHNFWYDVHGGTEMYVLPSTCFVRHDYSEMYRIDGGDQFGRNDVSKLGFATLEVHETGHVVHYHRTEGRTLAPGEARPPVAYPRTHVRTVEAPRLSVDLRHAWAEEMTVAPSGAVDEFRRKTARNDYPVMALWEMGLAGLRVPVQDLLDPRVRRRMELMRDVGHRFQVYLYDLPDDATAETLAAHAHLIARLELVIGWDRRAALMPRIETLAGRVGAPLVLSRVNRKDAAKTAGGRYNHLISHGFALEEAEELAALPREAGIAGFLFSIPREVAPAGAVARLEEFAEASGAAPVLYVKSTSASPWADFRDDGANALRIAEAAMAAAAARRTEIVLDTFVDADRGYFVRTGLVDRRYAPRLAARMLTALVPLLVGRAWRAGGQPRTLVADGGVRLAVGAAEEPTLAAAASGRWWHPASGAGGPLPVPADLPPADLVIVEAAG